MMKGKEIWYMEKIETGQTTWANSMINPHHSKLLDLHTYSDHSACTEVVQLIWKKCYGQPACVAPSPGGVKPKSSGLKQFRTVILDLYSAWSTDPDLSIAVSMSNSAWKTGSRYNKLGLSRKVPLMIHSLHEHGFIDLSAGSYAGPGVPSNRTTRIRAAEPLRRLFRDAKFGPQHILDFPGKESIIMRGAGKTERNLEYTDTPETELMRGDLTRYNRLLARTHIDVPEQVEPFIERPITTGYRAGQVARVSVCGMDHFVHRIFNRNNWACGGRFYGGWWQGVGSEFRKRIYINGQPTVEVDYQALHVAILSAKHGVDLEGDPYALEDGLVEGMPPEHQRKLVKLLVLMGLNAPTRNVTCSAFRDASPTGSRAKSMKNVELFRVLDAFIEKHPFLADELCSDQGIHLMNTDSRIASMIINKFTKEDIPVLCIHDSFIIDYSLGKRLKAAMTEAAVSILGRPVGLSNNYLGIDEIEEATPHLVKDYFMMRRRPHSSAYRLRQRLFNERRIYLRSGGFGIE